MNNNLKQALIDWSQETDWTIFGTLKFIPEMNVTEYAADKLIKLYWNKLGRAFYGRCMLEDGYGINRFVYKQFGEGNNIHYHYVAKPAFAPHVFIPVATKIWNDIACCYDAQIEPIRTVAGSTVYTAHEFTALNMDTLDTATTANRHIEHAAADIRSIYQTRRLLKQLETNEFDKKAA